MKLQPYFSIDIETTGLDLNKSQILEIGIVYDDGESEIKDLPKYRCLIDNGVITHGESYALGMNADILKEIQQKDINVITLCQAKDFVENFIQTNNKNFPKACSFAGKNIANFDYPILKNNGFVLNAKHRFIDVGSLWYPMFGYIPSLDEINKKMCLEQVSHRALDDAINVVEAIRYICSITRY